MKLLKSFDLTEYFFSETKYSIFPHCVVWKSTYYKTQQFFMKSTLATYLKYIHHLRTYVVKSKNSFLKK